MFYLKIFSLPPLAPWPSWAATPLHPPKLRHWLLPYRYAPGVPRHCIAGTETSITLTLLVFTKRLYMFRFYIKAIIRLSIMPTSWTTYLKLHDMLAEPAVNYNYDKWSRQNHTYKLQADRKRLKIRFL
jgi:hypothetical protein